jgi:putative tricarboxylic transport membrane protein
MNDGTDRHRADRIGAAGSAVAIALGVAAFWGARDFSDLGAVFPRSVGALLVVLGSAYIALTLLGRTRRIDALGGSSVRRAATALVMLGWAFTLGPLGFLASSAAAMAALLVIAHHDRWTPRRAVAYAGACALVLIGLYSLFKFALQVPLP